jgi:transposase
MPELDAGVLERFWDKVEKTETCWLWRGAGAPWYGNFNGPRKKFYKTHRFSWEIHNGPIPDGLWVLHKCDVQACVNPDHLWLGTARDNIRDMWQKGRGVAYDRSGGNHPRTHLTERDVRTIRTEIVEGVSYKELGEKYKISNQTVCSIKTGRNWPKVAKEDGLQPDLNRIHGRGNDISKFNFKTVVEIKKALRNGIMGVVLAKKYGVHPMDISNIKRGVTWKRV